MKKSINYILFLATILSCKSTSESVNPNEMIMWIHSTYQDCMGVAPQKCLLIKFNEEDNWQLYYDGIIGLNYEEGTSYKIKVRKEILDLKTVPADGSIIKYHFVELISKAKEASENLSGNWILEKYNENVMKDSNVNLEINLSSMAFFGKDGCNSFSGKIKNVDDSKITFGLMMGTKMYCEGKMEFASQFASSLQKSVEYKIENNKLIITSNNSTLIFVK